MTTLPPVTDALARFVAGTDFSTISDKALDNAKLHMLDTLGAALAALTTPVAMIAIDYCQKTGNTPEASIWGSGKKASLPMTAFANGLLAHALDFDDWDAFIHAGHPSSMVLGAALSLSETLGASGRELLKAYVLGIEVIAKIAANAPNLQDRGFHSTPVWGSLGAAIAVASLLRLAPEKIKAALGIASSACGGIHRQQGSMVKPFHAGHAARTGIEAALLAEKGFTADPSIIEAPRGFCDTFFASLPCVSSPLPVVRGRNLFSIGVCEVFNVTMEDMIAGALEGTVAIDISGHVAGPYAGSLLGDLGCEVIKIELPDGGDTHRGRNPKYEGYGPSFRALNRNKKSITLNLREQKARGILLKLLNQADILIENFRPATRNRLGLDYEDLSKLNPRLIHCSISGYGQSGPYRDKPGFDTIGQALSGMLSLVTDLDNPMVAGFSITDHSAGIFAAHGIMAALLARQKTGRGQFVDVSLLQVSLAFIESHVADYLNGGEAVSRDNFPRGRIYCVLCADGKPLVIHLSGHQHAWEGLLKVVGRRDLLADARSADRRTRTEHHYELLAILREEFRRKPRAHWLAALDAENLPNAPINTIEEVFEDPQVKHIGIPKKIHHAKMGTTNLVGSPINLSDTPPQFFRPAPLLGENTEEILARFGYSPKAIADLRSEGVI